MAYRRLRENGKNPANQRSFRLQLLVVVWAVTKEFVDILTGTEFLLVYLETMKLGAEVEAGTQQH